MTRRISWSLETGRTREERRRFITLFPPGSVPRRSRRRRRTGTPCSAAARLQSSYSGEAVIAVPSRSPILIRIFPNSVATSSQRRSRQIRSHREIRTPRVEVSARTTAAIASVPVRIADHRQERPGPVLLHLDRGQKDVERARGEEPLHGRLVELGVEVVDVRLDDRDASGAER